MKTVCVTKGYKQHTSSGGYGQLAEYLDAVEVRRSELTSVPARVVEKAWNFCAGDKPYLESHLSHGYRFEDRIVEERAFWLAQRLRAPIVHALYGDWQLDLLLRRAALLPGRLVATFHLPAEAARDRFERAQKDLLARLDGAIVIASSQLADYARWLGPEKVTVIPHGIDTAVFQPAPGERGATARFVFVGMAMRDFETAHRVVDLCARNGLDAEFDVVLPKASNPLFIGCDNVRLHSDIGESQLIALYHGADALFLPLLAATANNAVLESLACGTPVISTAVGGVFDYVDATCGWLLPPRDPAAAYACIEAIVRDRDLASSKRRAARVKAERFSWQRVAAEVTAAYDRLISGTDFAACAQSL